VKNISGTNGGGKEALAVLCGSARSTAVTSPVCVTENKFKTAKDEERRE